MSPLSDAMENQTLDEQATTAALNELFGLGYDYHDKFADKIKAVELPATPPVPSNPSRPARRNERLGLPVRRVERT